jgi:hypothetical protein
LTSFPAFIKENASSHTETKNVSTGTIAMASSLPASTCKVKSAEPISAAGAASTPNINCGDVERSANARIGNTDPYRPYTAGSPAIKAYPIEIGIETAMMKSPAKISFPIFFLS